MRRLTLCVALVLVAACVSAPEETAPAEPEQPVEAPPPEPAPEPGPGRIVALLVGGEPSTMVPSETLASLGADAVAYLSSCREQERKAAGDPTAWQTAQSAPVCIAVHFVPPAEVVSVAGEALVVGDLLMPLGAPRWEGVVLTRKAEAPTTPGEAPWSALIAGDRAILDRLREKTAGALATLPASGR